MALTIKFFKSVYVLKDVPTTGLPEICISGRSNVGKSSLINRLASQHNLAKISQNPGKTQSLNFYSVGGTYYLVDLPGYGYARVSKAKRSAFAELMVSYLSMRRKLIGIIQLIDARHGPVSGDFDMLEWLNEWKGSVLYVFTKVDKLNAHDKRNIKEISEKEFNTENCVMFSARTGIGINSIRSWIDKTLLLTK